MNWVLWNESNLLESSCLFLEYGGARFERLERFPSKNESHSVISDSLWPYGLNSPWNSPSHNTGVGSLFLLQGIFKPRDRTQVSQVAGGFFTSWATRYAHYPKPCPLVASCSFSLSLNLFLFLGLCVLKTPHISEIIQYLSFSMWLISLSSNTLCAHRCCCKWQDSLLYYGLVTSHCACIHHIVSIHSSINGHLGCLLYLNYPLSLNFILILVSYVLTSFPS